MASSFCEMETELNKLQKNELIQIILYNKLPQDTSLTLSNFILGPKDNQKVLSLVMPWLDLYSNYEQLIFKHYEQWNRIVKPLFYLLTIKGSMILGTMALLYHQYPEELKEYALKSWNTTGSLYRCTERFVRENSGTVTRYVYLPEFAKQQMSNVWYYGVLIPASTAKSGLYYSGIGLQKLGSQIGYYCGPTSNSNEEPQKCDK